MRVSRLRDEGDPRLVARLVTRRPLLYADGADPGEDRPAHVRAGSGIAWLGSRLAIVQDDASFVALVDPATWVVDSVPLPRGAGGLRQFDDLRGNKADKLDLEACVAIEADGEPLLLAFGSGSTPAREKVALVRLRGGSLPEATLADVPALYAALRAVPELAGTELNVEGAVLVGNALWMVQRGNGAGEGAVNAMARLSWPEVWSLVSGAGGALSPPSNVVQYDLGAIDGVRLTFTDVTSAASGQLLYLATAEASPDAVRDGAVLGTALGVIGGGTVRSTLLVDAAGKPVVEKAEGIVLDRAVPRRAFVVLDADDPARPCELCEVQLEGPWR